MKATRKWLRWSVFCFVGAITAGTTAQGQTTNVFPTNGNVGVGTTSPGVPFQVGSSPYATSNYISLPAIIAGPPGTPATSGTLQSHGSLRLSTNTGNSQVLDIGIFDASPFGAWLQSGNAGALGRSFGGTPLALNPQGGFIGIGISAPVAPLHVAAGSDAGTGQSNCGTESSSCPSTLGSGYGIVVDSDYTNGQFRWRFEPIDRGNNISLYLQQTQASPNSFMNVARFGTNQYDGNSFAVFGNTYLGGNVGIGTTTPGYKLDVAGQIHTAAGVVYPDGNIQSVAWTGSLCGGDYAESIDVSDDRKKYEPGDLLVIDPKQKGKFLKSSTAYSKAVAGVYSTKPGVVGRRQTTAKNPDEVPMAMIGIVPTKVSAENGAIEPGDILVSSSTPGYAMKGTDSSRMLGAIVGKAMESLDAGQGTIEVLVTLQ